MSSSNASSSLPAPTQIWPDEFASRYRKAGYWRGETFGSYFKERVETSPEHLAVIDGTVRWTYKELDQRSDVLATAFLELGFKKGDRVVVQLPNVARFFSVVLGLFKAGILPVFALPAHRITEIVHFVETSGAVGYIFPDVSDGFNYCGLANDVQSRLHLSAVSSEQLKLIVCGSAGENTSMVELATLEAVQPMPVATPPQPYEVAFLQLSGGSTGLSKLIPRTHDDYVYTLRASAEICELSPQTRYLGVLPIAHNYAMSSPGTFGTFYAGGTVVLSPSPAPDIAFPIIEAEKVNITGVVPPIALIWVQAAGTSQYDISSLKVLQVGGAKLISEVAKRIKQTLNVTLQQVFGMAEGLVNYTRLNDSDDITTYTQGRPISIDDEILIVDDQDNPVKTGTPGNLLTRGPYTIRQYYNSPEANSKSFTADGYYRTGDIVIQRPDGYLEVQGRATDHINRGGEKVSAEEVEDHLLAHPQVHDAVVVSIPDEFLGEKTCAFVIPNGEAPKTSALKKWIRERGIAAYKIPDKIVFVSEFPSTSVGKVSRKELRSAIKALAMDTQEQSV